MVKLAHIVVQGLQGLQVSTVTPAIEALFEQDLEDDLRLVRRPG